MSCMVYKRLKHSVVAVCEILGEPLLFVLEHDDMDECVIKHGGLQSVSEHAPFLDILYDGWQVNWWFLAGVCI